MKKCLIRFKVWERKDLYCLANAILFGYFEITKYDFWNENMEKKTYLSSRSGMFNCVAGHQSVRVILKEIFSLKK